MVEILGDDVSVKKEKLTFYDKAFTASFLLKDIIKKMIILTSEKITFSVKCVRTEDSTRHLFL